MLRVGLIGLGGVAERIHLPAISQVAGIELVGACEPDNSRREEIGKRFKIRSLYPDALSLLDQEKPDMVIIGSPPDTHHNLSLKALERGTHVFCEKPFVSNVSEADQVIEASQKSGRLVVVNNQYRFMEIYRVTQQMLEKREFGRLFLIQCWQQMFHPPYKEKNWRTGLIQSTLFEFGTHALDLLCFFFGALPTSINAHIIHPRQEIEADVVVAVTLRFPDEGLATMVFNRISHAPERYFEMRLDCFDASIRISLGGVARASLDWSKALGRPISRLSFVKGGEARLEKGGRSKIIAKEPEMAFASATAKNLSKFVKMIEAGEKSTVAAEHARELIRLVFAGYESAKTGETIRLQERRSEYFV
jgi:D-apiose dehydrogenase